MNKFKTPLVVRIETTFVCNHNCPYCYKEDMLNTDNYDKEKEDKLKKIIDKLIEWNIFDITFTGGEPLAEKKVLKNIIKYLREKSDIDFSINSNLSLIDEKSAYFFKENNIAGMFVSFMSSNEEKFNIVAGGNYYLKTLEGFQFLKEANIRTTANMVVMKTPINNVNEVYETAKFLYEKFKIHKFSVAPASPSFEHQNKHIITNDEVIEMLDQMIAIENDFGIEVSLSRPIPLCFTSDLDKKYLKYDFFKGCTIGLANSLTINYNGEIKPCPVWDYKLGNIFNNELEDIVNNLSYLDGTDKKKLSAVLPKECENCEIISSCKGGCKTEAIAMTGKVDGKSRYMKNHTNNNLTDKIFIQYSLINEKLILKDKIKIRKDNENLYVVRGEKFAVLNKEEFNLFKKLFQQKEFILSSILDIKKYNESRLNLFLNKLASARVFENLYQIERIN
jgi:radical SAM protein with 4Fe4S-binding SPASM domain